MDDLLARAGRWVVAISVERTSDLAAGRGDGPARFPPEMRSYYERPPGWVSGVLVDAEGHVLTSLYNVGGEVKSLRVRLASGTTYAARSISRSPVDDIALLRIEKSESDPPIEFHEPLWAGAAPRTGSFVFALGRSPDPSRLTVTRGIVSAAQRNGGRAIQTDAELNYGNVGGPIVDLDGRIVALATFVGHTQPQWGINSGVGFGTTAVAITGMLPDLRRGGDFVAFRVPFLGVQGDRRFVDARAARIESVVENGPAGKAGIRAGDLIVEFNGSPVDSFDNLRRLIFASKVGETVSIKVRRGEENLEFKPTLAEQGGPR